MTRLERKAIAFASKFKSWDCFIAACSGYLNGFKDDGNDVEVDNSDGKHQLTERMFKAWSEGPFKLQLQQGVGNYQIVNVYVHEKDGEVSFQGIAKKIT